MHSAPPVSPEQTPALHSPLAPREQEAQRDLTGTRFSRGARVVLCVGFLLMLGAGFATALFIKAPHTSDHVSVGAAFARLLPRAELLVQARTPAAIWALLPSPSATRDVEKGLEDHSQLMSALRPRVQAFLTHFLGTGNQQVLPAAGGWLFFRKDVDYVNGAPFLKENVQKARQSKEHINPDSLGCIVDFQRQLAARSIRLVVVPVPVKPCIEGHRLTGTDVVRARHNVSFEDWVSRLREQGVTVYDATDVLLERLKTTGEPQYLATDTHWTPTAMEAVAGAVARAIEPLSAPPTRGLERNRPVVVSGLGDTLGLLGLPQDQALFTPEAVEIQPVTQENALWKPSPDSDVLLLGDSFSNIFSMGAMGWGEGAGFAEQLSVKLGRSVDAIVRNSDGAFATRQLLQRELASGHDRLRRKRVVVWELAARELAFGDWKQLSMQTGESPPASFYGIATGSRQRVTGIVSRLSSVPRPGSVPYREHIVCVHLVDVQAEGVGSGQECLVLTWSMKEQVLTSAAGLRPGDRVSFELQPWEDVAEALEKFQRSEFDEPALLAEPINWGEMLGTL